MVQKGVISSCRLTSLGCVSEDAVRGEPKAQLLRST